MFALCTLFVAVVLALALMVAGHYLLPKLLGRDLHRLEAYLCGCLLGILFPYTGWCLFWQAFAPAAQTNAGEPLPAWLAPLALLAIMAGAGAGTVLAWAADVMAGKRAELRMERGRGQP